MKTKILILLIAFTFLSCKTNNSETDGKAKMTFEKAKWIEIKGGDYPYRDEMLSDLMESGILKTLHKQEVLELLGEPNRTDENFLFYTVSQQRLAFWPLHTKTLVIKFSGENTVEWVKIHE
ncbi:hypothetical protein EZL74_05840 [Flavobacterium silvisoli]|uniref:Outer membrane protein assembly factor BamE n=1 Tax=Flavobacterium silvisoli TaxID=2529433 RepID=A0A4Q9Z128_9FLAO|nr:hypothetical protein [Flavobacterium silvisoli]TBX69937.1 hypothetical protein EZL74_05840 [Flavobacterium silvisoli]